MLRKITLHARGENGIAITIKAHIEIPPEHPGIFYGDSQASAINCMRRHVASNLMQALAGMPYTNILLSDVKVS